MTLYSRIIFIVTLLRIKIIIKVEHNILSIRRWPKMDNFGFVTLYSGLVIPLVVFVLCVLVTIIYVNQDDIHEPSA